VHDTRPAVTRHPDAATLHTAVQITAAAVLLQEGIKRGEKSGHVDRVGIPGEAFKCPV